MSNELILKGIDGANPLGFLAAVGTIAVAQFFCSNLSMGWRRELGAWRPVLRGYEGDSTTFCEQILDAIINFSSIAFEFEKKMPFSVNRFIELINSVKDITKYKERRSADFIAAFGSEACTNKNVFQDTLFRMVRSGDAAGQGLPHYALAIKADLNINGIYRTLFEIWDYKDSGFSLRWDPMEDQRYALRWYDPSKNKDIHALGTMNGANALALEALQFFPSVPVGTNLETTGFSKEKIEKQQRVYFSWPIWNVMISKNTIRSLVSLGELRKKNPNRRQLTQRGIVEIYRCFRIAPNQYYRNFSQAFPV